MRLVFQSSLPRSQRMRKGRALAEANGRYIEPIAPDRLLGLVGKLPTLRRAGVEDDSCGLAGEFDEMHSRPDGAQVKDAWSAGNKDDVAAWAAARASACECGAVSRMASVAPFTAAA